MSLENSQSKRKAWVIITYGSVIATLLLFYFGQQGGWPLSLGILTMVSLVLVGMSLLWLHIRTRLWQLVHMSFDELDERQAQVVHNALRHSYAIFSVTVLAVIFYAAFAYRGNTSLAMLVLGALLHLAHTLPSSVIAWTEREV